MKITLIIISVLLILVIATISILYVKTKIDLKLTKKQYIEALYNAMFRNNVTRDATFSKLKEPYSFTIYPNGADDVEDQSWEILMEPLHSSKEEFCVFAKFSLVNLIFSPKFCIEWAKEHKKVLEQKEFPDYEKLKIILEDGEDAYFKKLDEELLAPF